MEGELGCGPAEWHSSHGWQHWRQFKVQSNLFAKACATQEWKAACESSDHLEQAVLDVAGSQVHLNLPSQWLFPDLFRD